MKEVVGRQVVAQAREAMWRRQTLVQAPLEFMGFPDGCGCDQTGILREFADRCGTRLAAAAGCWTAVPAVWGKRVDGLSGRAGVHGTQGVGHVGVPWERTCCQEREGRETTQISRAVACAREMLGRELASPPRTFLGALLSLLRSALLGSGQSLPLPSGCSAQHLAPYCFSRFCLFMFCGLESVGKKGGARDSGTKSMLPLHHLGARHGASGMLPQA